MTEATLSLDREDYEAILGHLIRPDSFLEEAAFGFAVPNSNFDDKAFRIIAWEPADPDDFLYRSAFNFELTDEMRGRLIKRAHDLSASIVEFHSHTDEFARARFSYSDRSGFAEIVPHVWWRLKGKPYFAVVVARRDFDSLAWIASADSTERLGALDVSGEFLRPNGLSPLELEDYEYTF